ncbi:MAG: ZIP family metal transporter [Clostridiales bacterium]|nr:ZIP family metal transporter [Clostridiales bacterium]
MLQDLACAGLGTGFTFLMTCAGAALVFFFRRNVSDALQRCFLGFAAGVMIAASVWSLLLPSIELGEEMGLPGWLPAATGFCLGVLFLLGLDHLLPHLHTVLNVREGLPAHLRRTTLLVLAVTLHNIPEGMAVGLSFALAAQSGGGQSAAWAAAAALALGIGIQNFPEGAAVSLPLRNEGMSRPRAFAVGALSGVVEPIFGLLAVLAAGLLRPAMPWLLSFAAGSMLYVVVEELIPEANMSPHSDLGTLGAMAGFLIMMVLDVALG